MNWTVLQNNDKPNLLASLLGGLAQSAPPALEKFAQRSRENTANTQQNKTLESLVGAPEGAFTGFSGDLRKAILESHEKKQLTGLELEGDKESYDTYEKTYGPNVAKVWKAVGKGEGRNDFNRFILDAKRRGEDVNALFAPLAQQIDEQNSPEANELMPSEQENPRPVNKPKQEPIQKFPEQKVPTHWLPKDWKKQLRTENKDFYRQTADNLNSIQSEQTLVKRMQKLNESHELPEGLDRLLINPETGEFYGLARLAGLENPTAQTFAKTLAEFSKNAKQTFGKQVTNFDLTQYMKRFPSLLNTYQGRKNILRQMEISDAISELHEQALVDIYEHYGLDGISQERADKLAKDHIKNQVGKLKEEFINIDSENESLNSQASSKKQTESFSDLPPADKNNGRTIKDSETGQTLRSNGKEWVKV